MPGAAVGVDVSYEERYWYPEDGGVVWIAGYQLASRSGISGVGRRS